jgi:GH24 family phage-related lysozyme (muramidase)
VAANPANRALVIASASALIFVGGWEGRSYIAYNDIVGVKTYCDGITNPPPIPGKVYTDAECNALTIKNVSKHGQGLLNCVTVKLNQNQYDALASWTYNVGVANACSSTLVRKLNAGQYQAACDELLRWNRAGGKVVQGLTNRRKAERELCLKPLPNKEATTAKESA